MNKGLIFNFSIEHFLSSQKKKNSEGKSARRCSLLIGLALNGTCGEDRQPLISLLKMMATITQSVCRFSV